MSSGDMFIIALLIAALLATYFEPVENKVVQYEDLLPPDIQGEVDE